MQAAAYKVIYQGLDIVGSKWVIDMNFDEDVGLLLKWYEENGIHVGKELAEVKENYRSGLFKTYNKMYLNRGKLVEPPPSSQPQFHQESQPSQPSQSGWR